MRIVIAVGGNALLGCDERSDTAGLLAHVRSAAIALAPIVREHEVVICFGNGPQVGPLERESSSHAALVSPYPLDAVGAQSQGMIGYWLSQALRNAGIVKPIVNLTTQVLVDPDDVAFSDPTTFVGAVCTESDARSAVDQHGWSIAPDGTGWRRTVPSPSPIRVIEQDSITRLVQAGSIVLCAGGGGVPVVEAASGQLDGVDAVIDKDLTAALIALDCAADRLLILTDVPAVVDHFGTAQAEPLGTVYVDELDPAAFAAGSMSPKVQACSTFAWASGHSASVGALDDAQNVLDGISGTRILDRRADDIAAGRRAI
ncbi:amino acid kinase family protein [Rhodococcoides navarretei]|uniref:Carbamate kinase n=1 Tax=Rhodococcus navarretei TaxID=3128981 RepID=A0ABU9D3T6_9NOCA